VEKKEGLRRSSRGNVPVKDRLTKSSRRNVVGKMRMRWGGGMGRKERVTRRCRRKEGRQGEIEQGQENVEGMEGDRARREVGGKKSARRRGRRERKRRRYWMGAAWRWEGTRDWWGGLEGEKQQEGSGRRREWRGGAGGRWGKGGKRQWSRRDVVGKRIMMGRSKWKGRGLESVKGRVGDVGRKERVKGGAGGKERMNFMGERCEMEGGR
jgi:hypothetical protein